MVEILDSSTESRVVARFTGRVSGDEYRVFLDAVDERLKARDRVDLVADLQDFEFYGDFAAFKEDFHFGVHEYRHVDRAAFVGDQRWVELFIKVLGPLFRATEKHFPSGQLEEAVSWVSAER